MPNWKNVIKNIAESVEVAAREAQARERAQESRVRRKRIVQRSETPQRTCGFWDCDDPIRADFIL
jgi:hypothetical protein